MLQGYTLFPRAYSGPLHTLQACTTHDAMDSMRLAIHLVLEGNGVAEDVTDSPAGDSSPDGVVCLQHVGSTCASCAKRAVLFLKIKVLPAPGLLPQRPAVRTCLQTSDKYERGFRELTQCFAPLGMHVEQELLVQHACAQKCY